MGGLGWDVENRPAGPHSLPRPGRQCCLPQWQFKGVRGHLASGSIRPITVASTRRIKALDVVHVPTQGQKQGPASSLNSTAKAGKVHCGGHSAGDPKEHMTRSRLDPGLLLIR